MPIPPEGSPAPGAVASAGRWRLTVRNVRDALFGLVPVVLGLLVASAVLPGLHLDAVSAVLVSIVVSVADALVRPLLRLVVGRLGAGAALLLGLVDAGRRPARPVGPR